MLEKKYHLELNFYLFIFSSAKGQWVKVIFYNYVVSLEKQDLCM